MWSFLTSPDNSRPIQDYTGLWALNWTREENREIKSLLDRLISTTITTGNGGYTNRHTEFMEFWGVYAPRNQVSIQHVQYK